MTLLRHLVIVFCAVMAVVGLYNTIHYFSEGLPSFLFNVGWMALFTLGAVALLRRERLT